MTAEEYCKLYLRSELKAITSTNRVFELSEIDDFEKAIIFHYTDEGYSVVNSVLRRSAGKLNTEFGVFLTEALGKLPNYEGLVYRCVTLNNSIIQHYMNAAMSGEPIVEHAFSSSSKRRSLAMYFPFNCLFRIYSRTGKEVERISRYGVHQPPNEQEVLFKCGTTFNVLGVTIESGYSLITMEEL